MAKQRALLAVMILACGLSFVANWLLSPPTSHTSQAVNLDTGELLPVYTGIPASLVETANK